MKQLAWLLLLTTIALQLRAQINTPAGATLPFGKNVEYPGHYLLPSNLPSGGQHDHAQHAADAYNAWKTNFVESCTGSPTMYRIKFDNTAETVSEGIGYGMLLAAYAADKDLFDGLWEYYQNYKNTRGLMHWKINGCSSVAGQNGATDADLDAAMALLVANHQWQGQNYGTAAQTLITDIKDHEIHPPPSYQTSNGDGWLLGNSSCRNPSYQSPAYYKAFGTFTANTTFWNQVSAASYTLLNANAHTSTGLVSNWCSPPGTPNTCNGSLEYGFDACRNPWRMAVDAAWNASPDAVDICGKISAYVGGVVATSIWNLKGPVPMDGSSAGLYHNSTFVATWAAGVVGTDTTRQALLNTLYDRTRTVEPNAPYFGSTLRVLSLFLMTGNFWHPFDVVECASSRSPNHSQIPDGEYRAGAISSSGTVQAGGNVSFRAEQGISLLAGFEAAYNSAFSAEIEACPTAAASKSGSNRNHLAQCREIKDGGERPLKCIPNLVGEDGRITVYYKAEKSAYDALELEIFHFSGELVGRIALPPSPKSGMGCHTYRPAGLPGGVYLFVLRSGSNILGTDKVVVN